MKVELKRPWFGPDGSRRQPGIHDDIPQVWEKLLPSTAKVLSEAVVEKPAAEPKSAK